jgi:pyridoxine 4-dehydrogenase
MQAHALASAAGTITIGSDLKVNRLGFGAMRLCGPGVWGPPADRANAIAVLQRAVDLGVNFIDTADSYGPNVDEEMIAEALRPYPKDLVIATKGGSLRPSPGQWERDCSPKHIREAIEGSLRRLKLDRIDLYQLHAVDPKVPWSEQVGVLAELQRAGKIRHVGLSNVTVDQLKGAEKLVAVVSVQNRYNVTDRKSELVLEDCAQRGIAFIPWFPLDAGDVRAHSQLQEIAASRGASLFQIAIAWLLQHSPVMLPIPGTQSLRHLDENVAAASIRLSDAEYAALGRLAA